MNSNICKDQTVEKVGASKGTTQSSPEFSESRKKFEFVQERFEIKHKIRNEGHHQPHTESIILSYLEMRVSQTHWTFSEQSGGK